MKSRAIGLLEVLGYSVAMDAMDKALKAADVEILAIDVNNPRQGEAAQIPNVFHVRLIGEVDHVREALAAAQQQALKYLAPEDVTTHLIAKAPEALMAVLKTGKVKPRRGRAL